MLIFLCITANISVIHSFSTRTSNNILSPDRAQIALLSKINEGILHAKNNKDAGEIHESNNDKWDLEEDWMLQDQVPLFTVKSSSNIHFVDSSASRRGGNVVTFWTQLRHSTPILSYRTEEELETRYRALYDLRTVANENIHRHNIPSCGPSPELLTDWWVDESSNVGKSGTGTVMLGGALLNGSKVWFPLHLAGTLSNQPWSHLGPGADHEISSLSHLPFSSTFGHVDQTSQLDFAEAVGGNIYELGVPRRSADIRQEVIEGRQQYDRNGNPIVPWLSSRSGSIFSIVTASILSALIAFGSDPLHQFQPSSASAVGNNPTTIVIQPASTSASTISPPKAMTTTSPLVSAGSTDVNEMSIGAQRARQELRVERDKITIKRIQDKLKLDEKKLQELQKEENRLESAKFGF